MKILIGTISTAVLIYILWLIFSNKKTDDAKPASKGPRVGRRLAYEGEPFDTENGASVQFGSDSRWVEKWINGPAKCDILTFGSDPAPGTRKLCRVIEY